MLRVEGSKKYWEEKGKLDLRKNKALTPEESGMTINAITIDLTKKCNLACKYCFTNLSKGCYAADDLTEEMGYKIVDWFMRDEVSGGPGQDLDITFWGGEPLLRYDLLQKLVLYAEDKAKKAGKSITFGGTTNVTLLTKDKFDFLDEHNVRFLLSIDGTKETHDRNRVFADGTGSWDIVDSRIDDILERWPNYSARLSFSTENIGNFIEDLKYLRSRGFKNIAYSPVCEGDWDETAIEELKKTWYEIADWWLEQYEAGDEFHVKYISDFLRETMGSYEQTVPCGAGRGYVGITIDGSIHPCHRFNKFNDERPWWEQETTIGHIDYGIINQEYRKLFIEWNGKEHMPESCSECPAHIKHCGGGCWASNWDIGGDIAATTKATCESTLANMEIARYIFEKSPELKEAYGPRRQSNRSGNNSMKAPSQGCQCYNADDNLFGRVTRNPHDNVSCLCNMSTYGDEPKPVQRCTCYNIEDSYATHYDNSGVRCGNYDENEILRAKVRELNSEEHSCNGHGDEGCCGGKEEEGHECKCGSKKEVNPIIDAIEYLQGLDEKQLSDDDKSHIAQFAKLLENN